MTSVLVVDGEVRIIAEQATSTVLVRREEVQQIVTVAEQGPPGPPGRDGLDGNVAGGALIAANRLSEFDDEIKKTAARTNLGLQVIDGGTFN